MLTFLRELEQFLRSLNQLALIPPNNGQMYLFAQEQQDNNMFRYKFSLPPVNPANPFGEVVNREIVAIRDGVVETMPLLSPDALITDWIENNNEGQVLRVELRDVDNAGNKSDPAVFREFTVVDNVLPQSPEGQLDIAEQEEV